MTGLPDLPRRVAGWERALAGMPSAMFDAVPRAFGPPVEPHRTRAREQPQAAGPLA
jgi:hypothetical protein